MNPICNGRAENWRRGHEKAMRTVARLLLACALVAAVAAFSVQPSVAQESGDPSSAAAGELVEIKLYFVRNGSLVVVHREVRMPEDKRVAQAALQLLVDGPTEQEAAFGVASAIPFLTDVIGVGLDEAAAVATATLTPNFLRQGIGGPALLRYAQVVYTLTQFPTIEGARIVADLESTEGRDNDSDAVTRLGVVYDRSALDGALNGVFFDSVGIGDRIATPLRLSGYANVFEGRFTARLLDLSGNELAALSLTASWGADYGTFNDELPFDAADSTSPLVILTVSAVSGYAGDRPMPDLVNLPLWLSA